MTEAAFDRLCCAAAKGADKNESSVGKGPKSTPQLSRPFDQRRGQRLSTALTVVLLAASPSTNSTTLLLTVASASGTIIDSGALSVTGEIVLSSLEI